MSVNELSQIDIIAYAYFIYGLIIRNERKITSNIMLNAHWSISCYGNFYITLNVMGCKR